MIALGIESTAHTFGVGIVSKKNVLVNLRDSYTTEKGGIIPTEAAEHHKKIAMDLVREAIEIFEKESKGKKIDLVVYSRGPGIGPCLHVGKNTAREVGKNLGVPVIGINHCVAHLSVGSLVTPVKDPVLLYASGANTQIIAYEGKKYRVFGETLDQGIGNFIDSFARHMGLGFPGGPKIEVLAKKGRKYIELPYSVKGMDISLSGMLTNLKNKFDSKEFSEKDLAYSLQETAFAMLVEVAERAMAHCGKKELLIGGGVGCNSRLQEMCAIMCKERGAKFYAPPKGLLVDNGAMIAYQGILEHCAGRKESKVEVRPYERTDDILVDWK
ncbi:tRNA (adenosine(37)-N6)-threonylcarbamoyltransferase complex transferase subunit TsaD [Candidatus Woesearchaeota archaeon]|nr:tRNA (adenosine(37)-N6)-threonylcarbamoyltransferase complex transferase subunit TsaD [Candidatus Woesearchaeota archaeon]MBT6044496.1 tRNA (adenosine(37)-N6)-threonylcarbamoyltransferase complex transferase subunit TsaD [Candidatus Woesearchaeota archaeon]